MDIVPRGLITWMMFGVMVFLPWGEGQLDLDFELGDLEPKRDSYPVEEYSPGEGERGLYSDLGWLKHASKRSGELDMVPSKRDRGYTIVNFPCIPKTRSAKCLNGGQGPLVKVKKIKAKKMFLCTCTCPYGYSKPRCQAENAYYRNKGKN